MTDLMPSTEPFNYTQKHLNLLAHLKDELGNPIKGWEVPEMIRYEMAGIPKKCQQQLDFIKHQGSVAGFGSTAYDCWAFDLDRLHSTLEIPADDEYLEPAQWYLDYQIARARRLKVKVLHAWSLQGSDWLKDLYLKNGFTISLREYISEINLDKFFAANFQSSTSKFEQSPYSISNLGVLKKLEPEWEAKLFHLWNSIERDVPNDVTVKLEYDLWKADLFCPWFKDEDIYIVLDKDRWVALSAYARSSQPNNAIYTDLSGVLPEYRRQGICNALKIYALEDLKRKGFKKTWTGNEENNPILQINLKLGFTQIGEEFGCQLRL